jgi:hypothetical protein
LSTPAAGEIVPLHGKRGRLTQRGKRNGSDVEWEGQQIARLN